MPTIERAPAGTRPERILNVAREVFLRRGTRGVTVAELAKLAHVGKGTMYLYWSSKEELLLELIAHDILDALDEVSRRLQADSSLILPHHLLPLLLEVIESHHLLTAVHTHDPELLGALNDHPSVLALTELVGPETTLRSVLTVLRSHGLLRTDLDLGQQIVAASALLRGFADSTHPLALATAHTASPSTEDTRGVMSDMARLVLESPDPQTVDPVVVDEAIRHITASTAAARGRFLRSRPSREQSSNIDYRAGQ